MIRQKCCWSAPVVSWRRFPCPVWGWVALWLLHQQRWRTLEPFLTPTWPWSFMSVLCIRQPAITLGTLARSGGLERDSCEKLVQAFVTSRLDLNKFIFVELNGDTINTLEMVQNMAARVVSRTRVSEHITPVPIGLHWLPVQQRIQYKILLLAYKAQHGLAPHYIFEVLQSLSASTHFEVSHGRTQIVRAQRCNIMGKACLQQGCPSVVVVGGGFLSLSDMLTPWIHSNLCSKPTSSNTLSVEYCSILCGSILCGFETHGLFHGITPIVLHMKVIFSHIWRASCLTSHFQLSWLLLWSDTSNVLLE